MQNFQVEIVEYRPELNKYFKIINLEWIEKFFEVEPEDLATLEHPQEHLLDKGGAIFFAQVNGETVGTCGLKKWSDSEYELVKMGVLPNHRGLHLGELLGKAIIDKAQSLGCKRLFLESNSALKPALSLYRKLGFAGVEYQDSRCGYQRCDVTMELFLNP